VISDVHVFDQDEITRWTRSECFVEFAVVHPVRQFMTQLVIKDSPPRSWIDAVQVQLQSTCNTGGYESVMIAGHDSPRVVFPDPGGPYSRYL
jgi:hypothetical protein